MIYNLVNYLVTKFPTISFVANGFSVNSPIECISINQSGGIAAHWIDRQEITVQVLSRSKDSVKAKENIDQVYNELRNRFGLVLDPVTVDAILYPSITLWQISPIQTPGYLGSSDENLQQWVYNLMVIIQ